MKENKMEPMLHKRQRTSWLGKTIYSYEEIDSTNTEGKRLAEKGAPHGSVIRAQVQTAGRGRRGRSWSSPKDAGIWFSIILRPDIAQESAPVLTLAAAMAVVRAIRRLPGAKPQIKWPNDVVMSGKKVCGILTEMSPQKEGVDYIVVGIGINMRQQAFPPDIIATATSLEQELPETVVSGEMLFTAVLEAFETYYDKFMQTGDASLFLEEYHGSLANKDRQVKVLDPQGDYEGIARGINRRGELLVEREGTLSTVNAGEVSVRGIYGYAP
ncbi:MAG: biotin--[acetyl-CoA-carboxylase] ligase [Lachnospiraceae bacterium]|jgi:BirA family biotin operon repressor/biotin-[acetyl-CoA-carboxylase] ligase|nr:biotin--[acetyl-CoA-carboxylase] ligase [Lachnospiraceae bacterium]